MILRKLVDKYQHKFCFISLFRNYIYFVKCFTKVENILFHQRVNKFVLSLYFFSSCEFVVLLKKLLKLSSVSIL